MFTVPIPLPRTNKHNKTAVQLLITYRAYTFRLLTKTIVGLKVRTSDMAQTLGSADV
jgi:hypothetical protein